MVVETPAEKTKAAAESGNAATQAAGQAAVDYAKTPMDKARQTEGILEQSAEQRAAEPRKRRSSRGKGMEADDLLCSRNARPQKSLVGRAQWKINQPPSLER